MNSNHRVVVVAASVEGIDALARVASLLPATFPAFVIASVHGLRGDTVGRLMRNGQGLAARCRVLSDPEGEEIGPGWLYVAPVGFDPVFTAAGVVGQVRQDSDARVDHLFESAARFHGRDVIGVVLSGLGDDGTRGLRAIARVDGTRVVQSPSEAAFTHMPSNALLGDSVEHSVMLDGMGALLERLVAPSGSSHPATPAG